MRADARATVACSSTGVFHALAYLMSYNADSPHLVHFGFLPFSCSGLNEVPPWFFFSCPLDPKDVRLQDLRRTICPPGLAYLPYLQNIIIYLLINE